MISIFTSANFFHELKVSLRLNLPLIASEVVYALNAFFATMMIAHLGKFELAANALVWSIYLTVIVFFIGILCSISVLVSQSYGAKDHPAISVAFKQGLILAFICALPMSVIMCVIPDILLFFGQDQVVVSVAKPFFYSLSWSMLPLNIIVVMQQFLIGIGRTKLVMVMSIAAVPIEIFFYYVFLFGAFGFPNVGLAGIGYGLLASYLIIAIFFIGYLFWSKGTRVYHLFKKWWIVEEKFLLEILRVGFPMGVMWCSELAFFALVAVMMGKLGVNVLAAFQIADQYLMVALVILFALHQGVAIRVGNEVGRNDLGMIKLTTLVNVVIAICFLVFFSAFYLLFPEYAIKLDIDIGSVKYQEVVAETLRFFPLVALLLITDCIRIVVNGALRGLKDTKIQMVISWLGFWGIAFPVSYLLAFHLGFGGVGIWWGIITGLVANGIMLVVRFVAITKRINLLSLVTKR